MRPKIILLVLLAGLAGVTGIVTTKYEIETTSKRLNQDSGAFRLYSRHSYLCQWHCCGLDG